MLGKVINMSPMKTYAYKIIPLYGKVYLMPNYSTGTKHLTFIIAQVKKLEELEEETNTLIPPNSFVCCQEWAGNQLKEYTDSLGCKARDNKMTYTKLNKSLNYNPPKLRVEKE